MEEAEKFATSNRPCEQAPDRLLAEAARYLCSGFPPEMVSSIVEEVGAEAGDSSKEATPVGEAALTALESEYPECARALKVHGVERLAQRIDEGDPTFEERFVTLYDRVGSELLATDPERFLYLVSAIHPIPLSGRSARRLQSYFEAVALARADRYEEALEALDHLLRSDELDLHLAARTVNSKAVYSYITGRLQEAESGFSQSLTLWRRVGEPVREGMALLNLGALSHHLQHYDRAESYLEDALALFSQTREETWEASAHNNLGLVHRDRGDWPRAQRHLQEAARHYRRMKAPDLLGRALNNLGEVSLFQSRLSEAETYFEQALDTLQSRLFRIDVNLHLGLIQQIRGRSSEAQRSFEQARQDALHIGRKDILALVEYRLGDLLMRRGETDAALNHWLDAIDVIESMRSPMQEEGLRIALLGRWQQIYEALVLHYAAALAASEAFAWSERSRSRAFAEALGDESPGSAQVTADLKLCAEAVDVQATLGRDELFLSFFTTGVHARTEPFLQSLPSDSPLGQLMQVPAKIYLFRMSHDSLDMFECDLDPNLLTSLSPRGDRRRFLESSLLGELKRRLRLDELTSQSQQRVIISPHGPLHQIPLAALLAKEDGPGPILSHIPSGTVLVKERRRRTASQRGGPDTVVIGYRGSEEPQLLLAEEEAALVAQVTGGDCRLGATIDPDALVERVARADWLHFACHAAFDFAEPLDSYLQIAPGRRISAREILERWSLRAELVCLSACSSGVNRILRSDEPMGLIRSFLFAGARGVVATLWPVEDLPTFLLMGHLYRELLKRRDEPAAALTRSQQWLRTLSREQISDELHRRGTTSTPPIPPGPTPYAPLRFWSGFLYFGG